MARSGSFTGIGTTRTAYFRSDGDYRSGNNPGASTGIGIPGDGVSTKGFYVTALSGNSTDVLVYVNGKLSGTVTPGVTREFVTACTDGTAQGGRLELAAASGTVGGTFGTLD